MKKILSTLALAMALVGCGGKEESKDVLYVYGGMRIARAGDKRL